MAQLSIGNFTFTFSQMKTMKFQILRETDPTGMDEEYQRVDLEVMGLCNPYALGTGPTKGAPGAATSDPISFTMFNLRDALMQPRQLVTFTLGNVIVLQSPTTAVGAGGVGIPKPCDARGGPIIDDVRFTQFSGDKTGLLYCRLHTWQSYNPAYCRSNRWTIDAHTDDMGMTTRTIHGRASFRKDALDTNPTPLYADDFRYCLVPPCDPAMRRTGMRVIQNAIGSEVQYTAIDTEMNLATGQNSYVVRIECLPSVGISSNLKDTKAVIDKALEGGRAILRGDVLSALAAAWSAVPTSKASGICRVWGRKGAPFNTLIATAVATLLDRFSPAMTSFAACLSAWVTTNSDTDNPPFVEIRMEFVGLNSAFLGAIFKGDPSVMLNTATAIRWPVGFTGPSPVLAGPPGTPSGAAAPAATKIIPPVLPGSNNTRGTWTGRLISQALISAASKGGAPAPLPPTLPPPPPPAPAPAVDIKTLK